jgi:predicted DNA-binding antitoxin AbrB/MazE fold protein
MGVRVVEAQYDDGVLRPTERLGLRPGERVNLIVVRRPDPSRWNLAKLANTTNEDDIALAEQGLAQWAADLDSTERS